MTTTGWQIASELAAFLSGLVLLWPAVRVNSILKLRADLYDILQSAADDSLDKRVVPRVLEQLGSPKASWARSDDWCLKGGLILFVASEVVKLLLLLFAASG